MKRTQGFAVTGENTKLKLDTGLESTTDRPKKILGVYITVSQWQGNTIEGYLETDRVVEINDRVIDTYYTPGAANAYCSTRKLNYIPIDFDLPVGKRFQIGVRSGATKNDIEGAYEYEITGT